LSAGTIQETDGRVLSAKGCAAELGLPDEPVHHATVDIA
jgi:hypothetical protein